MAEASSEICASTSRISECTHLEDTADSLPSTTDINTAPILNDSLGVAKLRSWLNKSLRIEMTDKRILIGVFLCTDRDANVILGACSEYLPEEEEFNEEPRMLGLVMVPGKHIVSVSIDGNNTVHSTSVSSEESLTDTE